jgi:hypothetical protein
MTTHFRQSVQMGELLRVHPQYQFSKSDQLRLRFPEQRVFLE